MCGIVFYGSKSPSSYEMEYFERAIICDTFRGYHSTGAFVGYSGTDDGKCIVASHKQVGEGWGFVNSEEWDEIRCVNKDPIPPARVVSKIYPNFAVGHNRHATMGAKTAENAHPFNHGDVTLVHNGTMDDTFLLVDNQKFIVDSDNICYAINKQGIAETIKQMDGAYTLIWHDGRDDTLNILRNDQRPFHLLKTTTGDWLGASEEEMLLWLQCRNKYNIVNKFVPTVEKHFECEVGVQYVFDVAKGNFELKEEIKHELPKFPAYSKYNNYGYGYGYSNGYGYDYGSRQSTNLENKPGQSSTYTPSTAIYQSVENIIQEDAKLTKVKRGSVINFLTFDFKQYPNNQDGKGKLVGMIENHEIYVEVHAHYFDKQDFVDMAYMYGTVKSAYNQHGVVTLIVDNVTNVDPRLKELDLVDEDENQSEVDFSEDVIQAADGVCYTRESWNRSDNCRCGWCDSSISFEDAGSASMFTGAMICGSCSEEIADELNVATKISLDEDDDLEAPFEIGQTFVCHSCAREKNIKMESLRHCCCTECYDRFYAPSGNVTVLKKSLKNGMIVNYQTWAVINTCKSCSKQIPWKDAEDTMFDRSGTNAQCTTCADKLI